MGSTVTISIPTEADLSPESIGGARRYKIRFPTVEAFQAARAAELPTMYRPAVASERRRFLSVELPTSRSVVASAVRNEAATLTMFESEFGARVVEDFRYTMEMTEIFEGAAFRSEEHAQASLDDVLAMIRATECWEDSRGGDVVLAVVDTGIDGTRPEFPEWKRAGSWQDLGKKPWTDWQGHGTMCAAIAAGTRSAGGRFDGVAPDARLVACRTNFFDSQLADVYDYLRDRVVQNGWNVVATNSFGIPSGSAPPPPPDSDFIPALDAAIDAGVKVFFSAGNYHELVGGKADGCSPTSIWLHKCRSDVMSVATCKLDRTMWSYSSRGPGQHHGEPRHGAKPDVTAPTPENGLVVYGGNVVVLENGWGTSGACPQAAGLGALLMARRPDLDFSRVFDVIRGTANKAGHGPACEGEGIIDCRSALDAVMTA
jgi:serine protease AprX